MEMTHVHVRGLPEIVTPWLLPMMSAERDLPMKPLAEGGAEGGAGGVWAGGAAGSGEGSCWPRPG